ncbi:unnamed protein product [Gordionus sp. m RMFG-2023]
MSQLKNIQSLLVVSFLLVCVIIWSSHNVHGGISSETSFNTSECSKNFPNSTLYLSPGEVWKSAQPCMKCMCSLRGLEMTMECHTCASFSSSCFTVDDTALYPDCCPRPCRIMPSNNNTI